MFDFLPAVPVEELSDAPLVKVIAQVKFDAQSVLSTHDGVSLFRDQLRQRYPRLLSEQQQTFTAGPGGITTTAVPQWRLTDLSGDWSCVVGPEQLTLETKSYLKWGDMRNRIEEALDGLAEVGQLQVRERVGLRYVNHVQPGESGDFTSQVGGDLLGLVGQPSWRQALTTSLGQTVARDGTAQLALRYGTGVGVIEPTNLFVIDIDCADEQPDRYDKIGILSCFDSFNDVAYRCFRACIVGTGQTAPN